MKDKTQAQPGTLGSLDPTNTTLRPTIADAIHQLAYPRQWRIDVPVLIPSQAEESDVTVGKEDSQSAEPQDNSGVADRMVGEFATCLWYLKTKHFRRDWKSDDNGDDDPRVRRALGRINRAVDMLSRCHVEIDDPTDRRYPQGGENMMKPIEFQPTEGITFEKVTETVLPIVYRDDRLVQRGEVFVAVPREAPAPSPTTDDDKIVCSTARPIASETATDTTSQDFDPSGEQESPREDPEVTVPRPPEDWTREAVSAVEDGADSVAPSGDESIIDSEATNSGESDPNIREQSDAEDSTGSESQFVSETAGTDDECNDRQESASSEDDESTCEGEVDDPGKVPELKTK